MKLKKNFLSSDMNKDEIGPYLLARPIENFSMKNRTRLQYKIAL